MSRIGGCSGPRRSQQNESFPNSSVNPNLRGYLSMLTTNLTLYNYYIIDYNESVGVKYPPNSADRPTKIPLYPEIEEPVVLNINI